MPSDKAIAARVLRDDCHWTNERIAETFSVHPSTVGRWLESLAEAATQEHSAADELETLLATVELDALGNFNAAIARDLAARLDKCRNSPVAQDSMAIGGIAKELRAVVSELLGPGEDDVEWVRGLFSE